MAELPVLRGTRLLIRPLAAADLALYQSLYTDPATMGRIMAPLSQAEAGRAFGLERRAQAATGARRMTWTLADKHEGRAFGLLGLVLDDDGGAEVGVVLPPGRQGRGYATEAIRAVARFAFGPLGLDRLHTRHARGHAPAEGLMRGLSFEPAAAGPAPHPVRWVLARTAWRSAGRDKPDPFG